MNSNFSLVCFLACFIASTTARDAIIGGDRAKFEQFPYQVSVQILRAHRRHDHICGGGIIGDELILTAAHCILKNDGHYRLSGMSVLVGTNDLKYNGRLAMRVDVKKIFMLTDYKPPAKNSTADIAVLKLIHSLELSKHTYLRALRLPEKKRMNYRDKVAKIAGWGWTWLDKRSMIEKGGYNDTQLRSAEAYVVGTKQCQEGYGKISKKHICARIKQNHVSTARGVCKGDSGGPLVYDWTVIGVLSVSPNGCTEENIAAVYTRVSRYLGFIDYAVKDEKTKKKPKKVIILEPQK